VDEWHYALLVLQARNDDDDDDDDDDRQQTITCLNVFFKLK